MKAMDIISDRTDVTSGSVEVFGGTPDEMLVSAGMGIVMVPEA